MTRMRIGILSDIHGNLPALEAVLADMSRRSLDAMFCLGDLVGYGAFPNEVTATIKTSGIPTIMGNSTMAWASIATSAAVRIETPARKRAATAR